MNEIRFFDKLPEEAKHIRITVFVNEQGFSNELDEIDNTAIHALLFLGRIAVLKEFRGLDLGTEIVKAMFEKAKSLGAEKCEISAQCRAMEFYKKLGFKEDGEAYLDEYCPHIHMEKSL